MDAFPALDPIPLPAPVWVFKGLNTITLALHMVAVQFLVGGLMLAIFWAFLGRVQKDPLRITASGLITNRLPMVMTFVINLGIPPLLFTQVLYGRSLYTSSVLIGFWWISVVPFMIIGYTFLYLTAKASVNGKWAGWIGLIALLFVLKVGIIFSRVSTLMLEPQTWNELYRTNALGTHFGGGQDMWARWTFFTVGSIGLAGVALLLMTLKGSISTDVSHFLRTRGGVLLAVFTVVQIGLAVWAVQTVPQLVRDALMGHGGYRIVIGLWAASAVALIALGAMGTRLRAAWLPWTSLGVGLVNIILLCQVRDGIRDIALLQQGFDVWNQPVVTNWSTVGLFLVLFVVAVVAVLWMGWVLLRAKPIEERYA